MINKNPLCFDLFEFTLTFFEIFAFSLVRRNPLPTRQETDGGISPKSRIFRVFHVNSGRTSAQLHQLQFINKPDHRQRLLNRSIPIRPRNSFTVRQQIRRKLGATPRISKLSSAQSLFQPMEDSRRGRIRIRW